MERRGAPDRLDAGGLDHVPNPMRDARRSRHTSRFGYCIHRQTLRENLEDNVGSAGQFEGYC
jgi:hypothetical protein